MLKTGQLRQHLSIFSTSPPFFLLFAIAQVALHPHFTPLHGHNTFTIVALFNQRDFPDSSARLPIRPFAHSQGEGATLAKFQSTFPGNAVFRKEKTLLLGAQHCCESAMHGAKPAPWRHISSFTVVLANMGNVALDTRAKRSISALVSAMATESEVMAWQQDNVGGCAYSAPGG